MKKSIKLSLVAASIAAMPYLSHAAGMGRLTVLSALGQPLRAEIVVNATSDELQSLAATVPEASEFRQAGVAISPVLSDIRVAIERRGSGAVVRLSSDRPINEPFVDMMVELNWANGRLIREYTFLLDPAQASPGKPVSAVAQPAMRQAPQVAPIARMSGGSIGATARPDNYRVRRGDTLNRIAQETRPDGVSLDQMLVALFRANPSAFDGNMNRLRAGRILSVPAEDAVRSIDQVQARREVVAQSADFADYRRRLAQATMDMTPAASPADQQSSGRIAPKVSEAPNAVTEAKDQVRVSKTEMSQTPEGGSGVSADSSRLQALEEDLLARDKALKEANARLAELEKNILQLQQLIELKSKGMAELQAAAAPAQNVAASGSGQSVPPPVAEGTAGPVASETVPPAQPAPSETPAPVAETKPAPSVQPPPPTEPPPPEPGFLDEILSNPLNLAAGGGLLALLLGWGFYRKRKAAEPAGLSQGGVATELSIGGASVFGASGGQSVDTGSSIIQTDFSQSGMTSIDADEGVDPVAEADVYMAYGRDAQAEEILLDALKADPARTAVHLKLLEIYAQRKNLKQFEHTATELYSQTQGQGADWQKAAAMGRKLDPANPLYGEDGVEADIAGGSTGALAGGGASAVTASAAAAGLAGSAGLGNEEAPASAPEAIESLDFVGAEVGGKGSVTEMPTSNAELKDTWAMPGDLNQFVDGESAAAGVASPQSPGEGLAPMEGSDIDFNLDLGDAPTEEITDVGIPVGEDDSVGISSALEFDLDIAEDAPAHAGVSDANAESHLAETLVEGDPLAEVEAEEARLGDSVGLDFDLDVAETDASQTEPMDLAATVSVSPVDALDNDDVAMVDLEKSNFDGTLLDFDFEPESTGTQPTTEATMLDLSSIDLDLEAPESGVEAEADEESAPLALPEIETPMPDIEGADQPDIDLQSEGDEEGIATKLELARAYEEMGDKDGARELLEEVLKEGGEAHQSQARAILERL
ncbi:MAG: hypothetical protein KF710_11225 [Rhodocyclaceae bacterium]|nr:hypothetical protein [Rhodocyclaceae bacterium]MCB1898007.1 hypothetical protein [Rhodocyclaceae bacterium]MCP5309588.1 hypothetical protein [Zoogloeaceae bacterium]